MGHRGRGVVHVPQLALGKRPQDRSGLAKWPLRPFGDPERFYEAATNSTGRLDRVVEMQHESYEFLIEEAHDFLHWLRECGVSVCKDMTTKELVFSPKSKMTRQMAGEAHRLRNYLARLIGPDVQVTMNPYNRSWN